MTPAAFRRLAFAGLLAAALSSTTAVAQDLDSLNEELRVETARLEYALEKVQKISYPVTGDDQRARKGLLKEGRFLMKQAAQVPRDAPDLIEEVIRLMGEKREEADSFLDNVKPLWADQINGRGNREGGYRSAYMEVIKFRDVAVGAESVVDGLTADEAARVADLRREGEDLVMAIKEVKESDHRERDRLIRELIKVREELLTLQEAGQTDRRRGYPFVAQSRNPHDWVNVHHTENGFQAIRARFLAPGSAYVTVTNLTDEARHLFAEIEFFTAAGDRIGEGVFETPALGELKPGETREILIPVFTSHRRFWDLADTYTLYLD